MGADFSNTWISDNKSKPSKKISTETRLPNKHQLHFAKEKRRGKVVTIVKPFYLDTSDLKTLLKTLKKKLGTGGTLRDGALEFQVDIPYTLRAQLEALDYKFKK